MNRKIPDWFWSAALFATLSTGSAGDNSFLWQQRLGSLLLDGHAPDRDPFSWIALPRQFVNPWWLANFWTALLERAGGLLLVRCFFVVLGAAFGALVWKVLRFSSSNIIAAALTGLIAYPYYIYWSTRANMIATTALLFLIWQVWTRRVTWQRLPLFILSFFVLGSTSPLWLPTSLILGIRCFERFFSRRSEAVVIGAGLLLGIASLSISPYGASSLVVPFEAIREHSRYAILFEWQQPSWEVNLGVFAYVAAVIASTALVVRWRRMAMDRRLQVLLGVAFLLTAYRWVLIGTVLVCLGLSETLTWAWSLRNRLTDVVIELHTLIAAGALVVVVGALLQTPNLPRSYPSAVLRALEMYAGPCKLQVFSSDDVSGYVTYAAWPNVSAFANDRTPGYPMEAYLDISRVEQGSNPVPILDKWSANAAVVPTEILQQDFFDQNDWKVVARTEELAALVRSACVPGSRSTR